MEKEKKRHHYLPVGYMNAFCQADGRIWIYRADKLGQPHLVSPNSVGFENYYYSQPLPSGGRDNNRLESFFSQVESNWPHIVEKLAKRESLRPSEEENLFTFITALRVRVPATRDISELVAINEAKDATIFLSQIGQLPPPPDSFPDILEHVQWTVDPHYSIHNMLPWIEAFGNVLSRIGFEIVHNRTKIDFATSDNPVLYFDPDLREEAMQPYRINPHGGRTELLVPLAPRLLLRGSTALPPQYPGMPFRHIEMTVPSDVRRVNRLVARFAYKFGLATSDNLTELFAKYADTSPTVRFSNLPTGDKGYFAGVEIVFGRRPTKPRWRPSDT